MSLNSYAQGDYVFGFKSPEETENPSGSGENPRDGGQNPRSESTPGEFTLFNEQLGTNGIGEFDLSKQNFGIGEFDLSKEKFGMIVEEEMDPEYVPIGSGLLILMAAGAGYAITKRKKQQH